MNTRSKNDTPKNNPTYPPIVLNRQGKSQTRYSSLYCIDQNSFSYTLSVILSMHYKPFFLYQSIINNCDGRNPTIFISIFKRFDPIFFNILVLVFIGIWRESITYLSLGTLLNFTLYLTWLHGVLHFFPFLGISTSSFLDMACLCNKSSSWSP